MRPPVHRKVFNCRKKRRYTDENEARACAAYDAKLNDLKRVRVYLCDLCGGWHMTTHVTKRTTEGIVKPDEPWPKEER